MAKASSSAGFTLVEVLIALSVFALTALGGVALLDVSLTSQDVLSQSADQTRAVQRMQAIMRADFGQMIERQSRGETGALESSFIPSQRGGLIELTRLGRLAGPETPRPTLEKIRYFLKDRTLYRSQYAHADGAAQMPAVALLSGVTAAKLRHFQRGAWGELRPETAQMPLPEAFEITLDHKTHGAIVMRYLTPVPAMPDLPEERAAF